MLHEKKKKQISKEVATLSSHLDKNLAALRKASQAWSFEFETAEGHSVILPIEEIVQAWQPNNIGFFRHAPCLWSTLVGVSF